ncbi:Adenylate cyclase type 1 [Thoreauomyces humboldtii]|nr:Adenylate cyclase type 1 [Thoreauomyces humboldtii]
MPQHRGPPLGVRAIGSNSRPPSASPLSVDDGSPISLAVPQTPPFDPASIPEPTLNEFLRETPAREEDIENCGLMPPPVVERSVVQRLMQQQQTKTTRATVRSRSFEKDVLSKSQQQDSRSQNHSPASSLIGRERREPAISEHGIADGNTTPPSRHVDKIKLRDSSDDQLSKNGSTSKHSGIGASLAPSRAGSSNLGSNSYVAIDVLPSDMMDGMPASTSRGQSANTQVSTSPGNSIWTRLKRHGQWVSAKMNLSAESLDDDSKADNESGSPATSTKSISRKQGKRPRSATIGQHSESRMSRWGGNSTDDAPAVNSVAAGPQAQPLQRDPRELRTRRLVGSTQQINNIDGRRGSDDPLTETLGHEAHMFRHIAGEEADLDDNYLSSPPDYLQSTMKDLFARAARNIPSVYTPPRRPTPLPQQQQQQPPAQPQPTLAPGSIQMTRRLSDRDGQPPRIAGRRESGGFVSTASSRRSSLRNSSGNVTTSVESNSMAHPRRQSLTERVGMNAMYPPLTESVLSRSYNDIRESSSNFVPGTERILFADDRRPFLTGEAVKSGGLVTISSSVPTTLSTVGTTQVAKSVDVLQRQLPQLTIGTNLRDGKDAPGHGVEAQTPTTVALLQQQAAADANGFPSSPRLTLARQTTIPSVTPTGVEPPDLSASSLNFETGGMLPEKYLAGPATSKASRKPSKRRAHRGSSTEDKSEGFGTPSLHSHTEDPDTIHRAPMGLWEAFQRPLSESPSTTWTLAFPPQIESLYLVWLFHLWMKPFQLSVLVIVLLFWTAWFVLEFFVFPGPTAIVPHIGTAITVATCAVGLWWSHHRSWERAWYRFMFATFAFMAIESLNISGYDLFHLDPDDDSVTRPTNTIRIIFVQTAIGAFAQLPFYQVAFLLWAFTIGQIVIEVTALIPNGQVFDPRLYLGDWLLYFACSLVGTYFRYTGEVHLRKAFIKYRIAYRNQERLFVARQQSEYLLSMILPAKVIETLHNLQGKVSDRLILSTHETFMELHGVTIMFADLVGFTEFSASITADTLVEVLSELFSEFDNLVTEFGLETIKTIGDCIQIAGGVPEQLESDEEIGDQAERVCAMALIMLTTTNRISLSIGRSLRLRIGIHTGTVIGGVMGLWKFKYDIWSRDVDIAALVEQSGRPSIPHVSQTTYSHLESRSGLSFSPAQTIMAFGTPLPTWDMLVLDDNEADALEKLAERLRVRDGTTGLAKNKKDGSGEAVTAAAVRQAIGASGPLVFSDLPNPMGRPVQGAKGKNNIGVMVKNFGRSIRFWTSVFKDKYMEENYRDNYVRDWPGAMILSSVIVFVCYLCLFGMHIAVFSTAPRATFAIEAVIGLIMFLLILHAHRINMPLRTETIQVMDKGDHVSSALWMTSAEEIGRRPENGSLPGTGSSRLSNPHQHPAMQPGPGIPRVSRVSEEDADAWRWFRPNSFALATILLVFVATMIHFDDISDQGTRYHAAGMSITIITGLVYPGIRIYYINLLLFITTFTFVVALLATLQSAIQLVPVLLVFAVTIRANRSYDIISRMNFYVKLQTERDYAETKTTQAAAERMLLNILPLNVVQRLKDNPALRIADDKAEVSILFCFISNTVLSLDDATEIETIWTLNDIICDIDALARSRSVEKIKTIGTKYMAMAETHPDVHEHHLERLCDFALDLVDVVRAFNARSGQSFGLRTGIHIGPAVCGLIGTKTFTFDVWGDTVNVASRMESTGQEEKIQVTRPVYERLQSRYTFTPRGTVFVKGKGDMETFFLVGRGIGTPRERRISMLAPGLLGRPGTVS